eukprot:948463-Lingulodinium_polyedra.AAC.1
MLDLEDISDWDGEDADDPEAGSQGADGTLNASRGDARDGTRPATPSKADLGPCGPDPKSHYPADVAKTVSVCDDNRALGALQAHDIGGCM